MNNIINFANKRMCEYHTIFPNVARLLDHLLFTNGNGYDFDAERGMLYEGYGKNRKYIDSHKAMTDKQWDEYIARLRLNIATEPHVLSGFYSPEEMAERIKEDQDKIKRVDVTEEMFLIENLYKQLVATQIENAARYAHLTNLMGDEHSFYRPYPFSPGYAKIYEINENSPQWLVQIGINFCAAWALFLANEVYTDHVSTDKNSYATLEYTAKYRDATAEQVVRLTGLLK